MIRNMLKSLTLAEIREVIQTLNDSLMYDHDFGNNFDNFGSNSVNYHLKTAANILDQHLRSELQKTKLDLEELSLIDQKKYIPAIKHLRDRSGLSLTESKTRIDMELENRIG
jgi:hypothetical protein